MQGTVVMPAVLAASFEAPECDDPAGGAAASVGFTGATLTRLVPAPGPAIPAPGGFPPEVPPGGVPAPGVPAGLPPLPPSSVPPPPDPNSVPPPDPPVAAVRTGTAPRSIRACAACSFSASSAALGVRTPPFSVCFGPSTPLRRALEGTTVVRRRGACCAPNPAHIPNPRINAMVRIPPPSSVLKAILGPAPCAVNGPENDALTPCQPAA